MSKERLEEIAYNVGISLDGEKALMSSDDYDFLYNYALQQAERVNELEVWYHSYHKEAKLNNILKIQNKRYREALKSIYEIIAYENEEKMIDVIIETVEKALKD